MQNKQRWTDSYPLKKLVKSYIRKIKQGYYITVNVRLSLLFLGSIIYSPDQLKPFQQGGYIEL